MRWFRFYDGALDDPKVQDLPPAVFKVWVNLLCLASRNGGRLPDVRTISFALRMRHDHCIKAILTLVKDGLLDEDQDGLKPHNWDARQYRSDQSNQRVREHRERKRNAQCNVTETVDVTPPEYTDTDNTETEVTPPLYPPPGGKEKWEDDCEADLEFQAAWSHFPTARKGNRQKAYRAWVQAKKRAEPEVIIAGIRTYAASDEAREFPKGMQAWLNDDRWAVDYRRSVAGFNDELDRLLEVGSGHPH